MNYIRCAWCLEMKRDSEFSGADVDDDTGKPICVACVPADSPSPPKEGAGISDDFLSGVLGKALEDTYKDNPGAIPGVNQFTINPSEAKEALAMNEHIKVLIRLAYENAPPRSVAAITREASSRFIDAISLRIRTVLTPEAPPETQKRIAPLIVVDGAIEEGGKEATAYLMVLHLIHDKYLGLHRQYMYTVSGSPEDQKRAEDGSHLALWHIRALISRGVMGKKLPIEEIKRKGRFYKKP